MDQGQVLALASSYAATAQKQLPIVRVWLYGSWARGEQTEDSDIDLAFEMREEQENRLQTSKKLYKLRRNFDLRIEPVIIDPEHDRSGFSQSIQKTGIPVQLTHKD
jgi:uncharacterized protein